MGIVTEYMTAGLLDLLRKRGHTLTFADILGLAKDIAKGMRVNYF
jgi:hypothetical protein